MRELETVGGGRGVVEPVTTDGRNPRGRPRRKTRTKLRALSLAFLVGASMLGLVAFSGTAAAAGNNGLLAGGDAGVPSTPEGADAAVNVSAAVIDNESAAVVTVGYNFTEMEIEPSDTQLTLSDPRDPTAVMDTQSLDGLGKEGTATLTIAAGNYEGVDSYEVSLDDIQAGGFVTNDLGALETRAVGTSPSIDMPDFQTRGNGQTDVQVGYNAEGQGAGQINIRMLDGAGNVVTTDDLSGDPKGAANLTVPDDANFEPGETTFELHLDGVGDPPDETDTANYTLEPYVSSQFVTLLEGPGDTNNIDVETETLAFGQETIFLVDLVDSTATGFDKLDLSGGGVGADETTLLKLEFTVENFDPDVLQGPGDVEEWQTTENGDGSWDVTIEVRPTSVYWNEKADQEGDFNPSNWKDGWEVADLGSAATVSLGISDLPDGEPFADKLTGARLNTDAQHYMPPVVDNQGGTLSIDVAAPHCQDDATTYDVPNDVCVDGSVNDDGFYSAVMPKDLVDWLWGDVDVDGLAGQYTSGGSTESLDMTVVENQNGDLVVDVTNIHYSSGTVELQEDSEDPTADAGTDISVEEGESFDFDGSGSSDNRLVAGYEWDPDDDGSFDLTGESPSHSYDDAGEYTVTLRVTDGNDNTDIDTITVSVSATDDGSSGGSGGGGSTDETSVTTPSPAESTGDGATATIEQVSATDPVVEIPVGDVATAAFEVEEVTATFDQGTNIENTVSISVSDVPLGDTPSPPSDSAIGYVSVEIDGNLADRVTEGSFTLDLSGTDVDPADVTAHHYHGGEWQEVETVVVDETSVRVVTSGYSVFAISVDGTGDRTTESGTPTTMETTTETGTSPSTDTPADARTTPGTATAVPDGQPGFGPGVLLVALVLVVLLGMRRLG